MSINWQPSEDRRKDSSLVNNSDPKLFFCQISKPMEDKPLI